jgi:YidC/Oxa1 family membrane protein insertase
MNDKRSAIAVIASIMVILVYTQLFIQPMYDQGRVSSSTTTQGVTTPQPDSVPGQLNSSQVPTENGAVSGATTPVTTTRILQTPTVQQLSESKTTTFVNDSLRISINHLGARFERAFLTRYKRTLKGAESLDLLFDNTGHTLLAGRVKKDQTSDDLTVYALSEVSGAELRGNEYVLAKGAKELRFVFTGILASGEAIKKTFTLPEHGYLIGLRAEVSGVAQPGVPVSVEWSHYLTDPEIANRLDPKELEYLASDKASETRTFGHALASALKPGEFKQIGFAQWVGFGGTYFLEALSKVEGGITSIGRDSENRFYASIAGEPTHVDLNVYLGPKSRTILKEAGNDLNKSVDLGIFAVVAEPLMLLLKLLYTIFGNYGLGIIALTLLVKLSLYPFAKRSFDSMSKMQEIQPEMKKLQELHKNDTPRLQQEMSALYKRKGVNPLGGCLPLFLQIPVFLGLYNGLMKSVELRHEAFGLWINDLSAPESLNVFGISIPVMILLMGASMIWQQWTTPSSADPQQKKIMMMMPIVFSAMFIIFPMPSGLVLYWLVNNVISIVQQNYMRSHSKANPLHATLLASGGIFALAYIITLL